MRSRGAGGIIGVVLSAVVVFHGAAAHADCHNVGVASGSRSFTISPNSSTGSILWNASSRFWQANSSPNAMATGKCLTTWFDWSSTGSHLDARAVRNCRHNTSYAYGRYDTLTGGAVINVGMQKWSVCREPYDAGCPAGTGSAPGAPGSHPGCNLTWNHVLTTGNMTTLYRIKTASGQILPHDGGLIHEPNS